jgi:hypothetical protein
MYEEYMMDDAEVCVVAFGITARVSKTHKRRERKGYQGGYDKAYNALALPQGNSCRESKTGQGLHLGGTLQRTDD